MKATTTRKATAPKRQQGIPRFPWVECSIHGLRLSYLVCPHVVKGEKVAHAARPKDGRPGEILCHRKDHKTFSLDIECAKCAENRWLQDYV